MLTLGVISAPGYKIVLFFHIADGRALSDPTFAYGDLFSVLPNTRRRALRPVARHAADSDRYLINPAMIVLLIAGIVVLDHQRQRLEGRQFVVVWGFIAIIALLRHPARFFAPR